MSDELDPRGLEAARILELLDFDRCSGALVWKCSRGKAKAGATAGSIDRKTGYLRVGVDGIDYLAHRVVWLYCYGEWPTSHIDHINRVKTDNRIENLRLASFSENNSNVVGRNVTGFKGVRWHKKSKKWQAEIQKNGKYYFLGGHETPELAHKAYCDAAQKLHGDFACTFTRPAEPVTVQGRVK